MLQDKLPLHGKVTSLYYKLTRRSLSNAEVNDIQERVRNRLTTTFGVELR